MKIRIHHQELRFRLSPSDVDTLLKDRSMAETLKFAEGVSWSYALQLKGLAASVHATQGELTLSLPETEFSQWLESPEIEWHFHQNEPALTLLIEKDLKP